MTRDSRLEVADYRLVDTICSGRQPVEEPVRTYNLRAHNTAAGSQSSVCGDDDHRLQSGLGQGDKSVIAMTGCMDNLDAVGQSLQNALAR